MKITTFPEIHSGKERKKEGKEERLKNDLGLAFKKEETQPANSMKSF